MSIEEELFLFLRDISGEFVMILDNADELLDSGAPNVKEDFINLLEVILSQLKNLTFLLTTREKGKGKGKCSAESIFRYLQGINRK